MRVETAPVWEARDEDTILVIGSMTLGELLNGIDGVQPTPATKDPRDLRICSLTYNSRRAEPDCVFFALPGHTTDGNRFVDQAVSRGATAVVSAQGRPAALAGGVVWVQVPDARKALALAAANFYGHPAQALELVGVTGTNGKTTTTFLIDSVLRAAGRRSGLFGTILYRTPGRADAAPRTTPESLDLMRRLAGLSEEGGDSAVLEVSSHGLAMNRVWGLRFSAAVFTNLTRDHLDFHGTMENYFAAKRRLFEDTGAGSPANGIVNIDDPFGRQLAGLAARTLTYGLGRGADVFAADWKTSAHGVELTANTPAGPIELRSPLVGRVQVANILAATATAVALGIDGQAIAQGIARLENVPGRFERIAEGQPFLVAVDYAHSDDALRRLTQTARELKPHGRVLLLFGAGGDRDREKRPLMGEAAGRGADRVVVTSDNPRSEDPQAIVNDILPGLEKSKTRYQVELDRARAIQTILGEAKRGDVVLLAGKGHETRQIFSDRAVAFDDRVVARQALRALGYRRGKAGPKGGPNR